MGEDTATINLLADNSQETSLLSKMREGRESHTSIFMKFTQCKKYFSTHAFCFYEGKDGAYYNSRIERYLADGDQFITLVARNKKNLLKAMQKICSDVNYSSVRKMFFVDQDFDTQQPPHTDLYETPGYSIENFYVDEETFRRILRSVFYINESDPDYEICIKKYRETFEQFHKIILAFNARVKYKHQYDNDNHECSFSGIKNSHLVQISLDRVIKSHKHDEEIAKLDNKLHPDMEILSKVEQELSETENPFYTYRGKNELYCLVELLESMRRAYNCSNSNLFSAKLFNKVDFVASNDPLNTMSQFASTPQALIDFITNHQAQARKEL